MIKKLYQVIGVILASKLMMWAVPDSKRFIKGIVITAVVILLTMYFHSEYLGWAEISGKIGFISSSYIFKKSYYYNLSSASVFLYKKTNKKSLSQS